MTLQQEAKQETLLHTDYDEALEYVYSKYKLSFIINTLEKAQEELINLGWITSFNKLISDIR